jgi:hypothetical protein
MSQALQKTRAQRNAALARSSSSTRYVRLFQESGSGYIARRRVSGRFGRALRDILGDSFKGSGNPWIGAATSKSLAQRTKAVLPITEGVVLGPSCDMLMAVVTQGGDDNEQTHAPRSLDR